MIPPIASFIAFSENHLTPKKTPASPLKAGQGGYIPREKYFFHQLSPKMYIFRYGMLNTSFRKYTLPLLSPKKYKGEALLVRFVSVSRV
jgi:hypothetical protein